MQLSTVAYPYSSDVGLVVLRRNICHIHKGSKTPLHGRSGVLTPLKPPWVS